MKSRILVPVETILMALDNVRAQKFRSFLTVLGIVIGIMTVVAIASILTGLRKSTVQLIEEFGTSNIYAFHLTTGPKLGPEDRKEWTRKPLTPEDGAAILERATAVEDVANMGFIWHQDDSITYNGASYKRGQLKGVSANYGAIANLSLSQGRFISETDDRHRRDCMVLGVDAVDALFPSGGQIIGNQVKMGGRVFDIIGVLEKRKSSIFGENEEDSNVLIPYLTARKLSPRSDALMLMIKAREGQLKKALDQVEDVLRRQRGVKYDEPNNFDLSTADRLIEQFDSITAAIGLIAIAISGIGLMVGGIGVMNIMLVSVTERTHEIGIRKAIGARRRDIVVQFLFEAMTLTSLGGIIGILLAIAIGWLIKVLVPGLPASIPLWAVVTGLLVSMAVGLISGVWPARKASRLDPIECLRYE